MFYFRKNRYDSSFFNRDIYNILFSDKSRPFQRGSELHWKDCCAFSYPQQDTGFLNLLKNLPNGLFIWRISTRDKGLIRKAVKSGFGILCTMADLELDLEKVFLNKTERIRVAQKKDHKIIEGIAGKVFRLSRFHRDKFFAIHADEYHRQWARNCLRGRQADIVLVTGKDKPTGFIALSRDKDLKQTKIVLIAVSKDSQNKRIGVSLLKSAVLWSKKVNAKKILVRTEADNNALGFYLRNGFRILNFSFYLIKNNTV